VRRIIGPTNYLAACRRFYAALIRRGVDDFCAVAHGDDVPGGDGGRVMTAAERAELRDGVTRAC
jgi:hypothetical protein